MHSDITTGAMIHVPSGPFLMAYKNVKGLTRLEITPTAQLGHWEELAGYSLDGTVKPKRYYAVDLRKHMFTAHTGEVTEW